MYFSLKRCDLRDLKAFAMRTVIWCSGRSSRRCGSSKMKLGMCGSQLNFSDGLKGAKLNLR